MDNNLELIKDYVARHADNPPENLTLESKLNEIGIDSLAILELVFELEEKYGIRLPEDIPPPETVGQFLALIEQHKPTALQ
jgi:acyl carrier protein